MGVLQFQVVALADHGEDAGEAAVWTVRLLAELSQLDDVFVEEVAGGLVPGVKGTGASTGALLARITNLDALKALLDAVRGWCTRTERSVEVSIDGDVLKITGASREQQDRLIEAWLARHAPVV